MKQSKKILTGMLTTALMLTISATSVLGASTPTVTIATKPIYNEVANGYSEGMCLVKKGNDYIYLDANGKEVINLTKLKIGTVLEGNNGIRDCGAHDFHNGIASITVEDSGYKISGDSIANPDNVNTVYINKTGKVVYNLKNIVKRQYADQLKDHTYPNSYIISNTSGDYNNGVALCFYSGIRGIFNFSTQTLNISNKFLDISSNYNNFNDGLIPISDMNAGVPIETKDGPAVKDCDGYMDIKGNIVIKPHFGKAYPFNNGLAFVAQGGKLGVIDKTGKMVIKPQFDSFSNSEPFNYTAFVDGLAPVAKGKKWGVINKQGKTVAPFKYDYILPYRGKYAVVQLNGKYGYIDEKGKEVVKPQYDDANYVNKGIALVGSKGIYKLINMQNKAISSNTWKLGSSFISYNTPNAFCYKQNGKWGVAKITY